MKIDKPLIQQIIAHYENIGELLSVGSEDTVYYGDNLVIESTKGKYVVRYLPVNAKEINKVMYFYEYLNEQDFPTSRPIQTDHNDYFCELGVDKFVIQTHVQGISPLTETKEETKIFTQKVGKTLAILHNTLDTIDKKLIIEFDPDYLKKDIISKLTSIEVNDRIIYFPNLRASITNEFILNQFIKWRDKIDNLDTNNISLGFCHNNLKLDGFRISNSNELFAVPSMDDIHYNYRLYDLATFMIHSNLYQPDIAHMFFKDLYQEYLKYGNMKKHEIEHLKSFLQARYIYRYFQLFGSKEMSLARGVEPEKEIKEAMDDTISSLKNLESIPKKLYAELMDKKND